MVGLLLGAAPQAYVLGGLLIQQLGCIYCARGLCDECDKCELEPCHVRTSLSPAARVLTGVGRPLKNPEEVTDTLSTGRKRAATLYPIFKDQPCSWRGKKNCGGGLKPIVGCQNGFQVHRHHGPVKNTLRNEQGNVHLVCNSCHNRWHTLNDSIYDEEVYSKLLHLPEEATGEELAANELWWRTKNVKNTIN